MLWMLRVCTVVIYKANTVTINAIKGFLYGCLHVMYQPFLPSPASAATLAQQGSQYVAAVTAKNVSGHKADSTANQPAFAT